MSSALSLFANRLTVRAKLYLSVAAFTDMFATVITNTLFYFKHKVNMHGVLEMYLLSICLSFRSSFRLSLSLSLSVCFSVRPPIYLSACLSVRPPIYLSACLSVIQ